jgi:hypothetical protein
LIVVDNFVQDGPFLEELRRDEHWGTNKPYFWFDKNSLSPSPWLKLTRQIWLFAARFHDLGRYEGYELWSQVIQDRELGWHVDKDEHLWRTTGEVVNPSLGSIWYGHTGDVEGGFLETTNEKGTQLIEPVPNRLIIHHPGQQHMVHKCTAGMRRSFLTNLWERKPSEENFGSSPAY